MLEIDTEFEQGATAERLVLPGRVRTDRTWLMAERLAAVLRRQGFIVRVHFLVRWLERATASGSSRACPFCTAWAAPAAVT